jgi:hypothetical protein
LTFFGILNMVRFMKNPFVQFKFTQWANSLRWWQTLLWALAFTGSGLLALFNPIISALVFCELLVIVGIMSWRFTKPITTIILIAALALSAAPERSSAQERQKNQKTTVVECNAVILGGLVLVVGGFIVYKVVQFCKKALPPPPPPPPPPTPPPTNAPPSKMIGIVGNLKGITINLTQPEQATGYDISGYGWVDWTQTNNPVLFQDYIHLTMSNSVDMTTWSNAYTINIWMSSNSVETVLCDGTGTPTHTNWAAGNPYATSLTNALPCSAINPSIPKQFFKYGQ